MQKRFHQILKNHFNFLFHTPFLIAISGGIDSVVLAHLCKKEGLDFAFAHCNFQLRGVESDKDENFIIRLAKTLDIPYFVKKFKTQEKVTPGKSIELIARNQRYQWFSELLAQKNYSCLLTAHHLNDSSETFFINLLRGTGLKGLSGIPTQNGNIIRPLLNFTQNDIRTYANQEGIQWREDQSNQTDNYLRNRIRHHVIPLFENENTDFLNNFKKTQTHLKDAEKLLDDYKNTLREKLSFSKHQSVYFDIQQLKKQPHTPQVLHLLLADYGFTAWRDIQNLLSAQPGKRVFSKNYELLKDREYLILSPIQIPSKKEFIIDKYTQNLSFPEGVLKCKKGVKVTDFDRYKAYLATDKLSLPLRLRIWKKGDRFRPFGMSGYKKISDFLRDEKVPLRDKENTWVLLSNREIVWVLGHRISEDFKIEKEDSNILKIEWIR